MEEVTVHVTMGGWVSSNFWALPFIFFEELYNSEHDFSGFPKDELYEPRVTLTNSDEDE